MATPDRSRSRSPMSACLRVQICGPSGRELATIEAQRTWRIQNVLAAISEEPEARRCRRRIFCGQVELKGCLSLVEVGACDGALLTLVKTPAPLVATFVKGAGSYGRGYGAAVIWCSGSGERLHALAGHAGQVWSTVRSPDGKRLLTASNDKTAKLWCVASGRCLQTFTGHGDIVESAEFAPDGERVVTACSCRDPTAKIWCVSSGECLQTLAGHVSEVQWAGFSPNGKQVVTRSHDNTAKIWCAASGDCLNTFSNHHMRNQIDAPYWANYSPTGEQLAIGFANGTAKIWCVTTGRCLHTFPGQDDDVGVLSVQFSPDGRRLLVKYELIDAKIWCVISGDCLQSLGDAPLDMHLAFWVNTTLFSPDGKYVLTASSQGPLHPNAAKIWSSETGECLHSLECGHPKMSTDGKHVLVSSNQGMTKIWSVAAGECLQTLVHGHAGYVSATFSEEGELAATCSAGEGILKIWCIVSGECLCTCTVDNPVDHVMFFSQS